MKFLPKTLLILASLLSLEMYAQPAEDTLYTQIFFADGLDHRGVELSINGKIVGSNVYLKSNPIYSLCDFQLYILKGKNRRSLHVVSSQTRCKIRLKPEMILRLKSNDFLFEYDLIGKEKYLAVVCEQGRVYVTEFSHPPGFD